jgi:hypothetical protein
MSLTFSITFVSIEMCLHVFIITLMLVNMFVFVVIKLVNSCKIVYICK